MKKQLLIPVIAMSIVCLTNCVSIANDTGVEQNKDKAPVEKKIMGWDMKREFKGPPPKKINGPHKFHNKGPSKAEMDAKKAEFEKRLGLTEEQKKQIEENKVKDRERIKPIYEELKNKKHEMRKVDFDTTLSAEQKEVKKQELNLQIKDLKSKADSYRQENMKNFESILTEEQKTEFQKIKEEQKKTMEERRAKFEKMKKEKSEYHLPVQPKPEPVKK